MDKKWDVTPKGSGRWAKLFASIKPNGVLRICRKTHELLGSPAAVLLLYNPDEKTIGIHPCEPDAKDAFPLHAYGRHAGREVRAHPLLARHHLSLPYTVRFTSPAIDEDKVLNLDLRKTVPTKVSDRRSDMPF
jgi:hypothetical protein